MMICRLRRSSADCSQTPGRLLFVVAVIAAGLVSGGSSIAQSQAPVTPALHPPPQSSSKPQIAAPYDVTTRSQSILTHLNAVLRLYRDSEAPIQKVGEPSDLFYRDKAVMQATEIARFAFQSAQAEVALIDHAPQGQLVTSEAGSRAQRLQEMLATTRQRIAALKAQDAAFASRLESAPSKKRAQLQQQREQVSGEVELQTAMMDALGKLASMGGGSTGVGFAAQVSQLKRSVPGVAANKATVVAPTLENLSEARNMGVVGQARVVFSLLRTMQTIKNLMRESDHLHQQAVDLRTPLIAVLKSTIAEGQSFSQSADAAAAQPSGKAAQGAVPAPSALDTEKKFKELTTTFKVLSDAAVPLSEEIVTLEQNKASLQAWSSAVDEEYDSLLQALFLRVLLIAIALGVIFLFSELWRRGTKRYVRDVRRRRQLLVLRRFITGFLVGLVLIFGLVTQFSSLATFAGLITAGIAVGLQTVLLSIAAYFFIVGRYGIRAGDRVTIAGVTGDVVEVGLLRFYLMEMAGSGTDLYSTGRIAVFSNAVLFQAITPLYKQMPGTEFTWHELVVKLAPEADHRRVSEVVLKAINRVYKEYRGEIEQQHKKLEVWMDASVETPEVLSNLQLVDGGPQLCARFPVIIRRAAAIDEQVTELLLKAMATDESAKAAISGAPVIRATVRG